MTDLHTADPGVTASAGQLTRDELIALARECGAADAGVIPVSHPAVAEDRAGIARAFPGAKTLLGIVVAMNPTAIQSAYRSLANLEFHATGEEVEAIGRRIISRLRERGIRALLPPTGFPMEMEEFPEKGWVVSHKRVAEAAGLGKMGIHRNVIHPRLGNFILLNTILLDAEIAEPSVALDYNPCLSCKLCVAACPVGAIHPDGGFDFTACYTHNYREFMGGFEDWVHTVTDARSSHDYRRTTSTPETVSMWQSLAFGPNYKAAYCMAVCPAGEDVLAPFLADRAAFVREHVDPLQAKSETIYVRPNSDAERYVRQRFPHKRTKRTGTRLRPVSIENFFFGLPLLFQRRAAKEMTTRFHLVFTGSQAGEGTLVIERGTLTVTRGLTGSADLRIQADGGWWLKFVSQDCSLMDCIVRGRLRLIGDVRRMRDFQAAFAV